jgi:hypothetical protein
LVVVKRVWLAFGAALAVTSALPEAVAATKAEKCARYNEQLAHIAAEMREGGSKARQHKLEARRQKVLARKAKLGC